MKWLVALKPQQAIAVLCAIHFVAMAAMEMTTPFWAQHMRDLNVGSPHLLAWMSGLAYAGPMAMTMLFAPLWGRLGDRVGQKTMLVRALLALAGTQLWIALSNDVWSVLIARLTQGALAGFIATSQAYGCLLAKRQERGALIAKLQTMTALGSVLGPMVGGIVMSISGFNQTNMVATVLCGICVTFALLCLPTPQLAAIPVKVTSDLSDSNATWRKFMIPTVLGFLFSIVLMQSAKMMPQVFFAVYTEQVLDAPLWLTGACYGATALGLCLAASWWSRRFQALPRSKVLREIEWCCWACAVLLIALGFNHDLWFFILNRFLWGLLLAALLPVFYSLLSHEVGDSQQGWILGLGNSAAKAGALFGIAIGSVSMACLPLEWLFLPVGGIYVVTAIVIKLLNKKVSSESLSNEIGVVS